MPDSPPLPEFRFDISHPWASTAVDMTGHMWATGSSGEVKKVYFLVFICASTGGGHMEMVRDASSSSFANAFDRFCARCGVPNILLSDQGSNFKGY